MATLVNSSAILATVMDAFKTRVPMLNMLTLDARNDTLKLGQVAYAHVRALPSASTYDATTGYFNGANSTQDLLVDVPVTISTHAHVTLKLSYLKTLADTKFDIALGDCSYVLGKSIVDAALTKGALAANNTYTVTETVANTDYETLGALRAKMNDNDAGNERYGLVNTAVASALDSDPLIASKDYSGQQAGAEGLLRFRNVGGFREILEYPDLPTTANMTGLFFDKRNMVIRAGMPEDVSTLAQQLGFVQTEIMDMQQDPETGLALLMIKHGAPGVLDKYITFATIYGTAAGAQGGSAGTITDKAGVRLITA